MQLLGGFPFAVNDLGRTLANRTMMVELRKAQILKRLLLEARQRILNRKLAGGKLA